MLLLYNQCELVPCFVGTVGILRSAWHDDAAVGRNTLKGTAGNASGLGRTAYDLAQRTAFSKGTSADFLQR